VAPHGGSAPYGSRQGRKIALRGGEARLVREHHITTVAWRTPRVDCALMGDVSDSNLPRQAPLHPLLMERGPEGGVRRALQDRI
jgi:hypothetical protein